jgi:hypothetical protein
MSGKPVIAIDPGHNLDRDGGASYGKYSEDSIALNVAKSLTAICAKNGIKTIDCLPDNAKSVIDSLQQRVNKSNQNGATIYCSIHCNVATPTDGARGCETYAISSAGKTIATNINRELGKLGFKIRGVKESLDGGSAPYVVRNTNATAVLVEICFLDAAEDTKILDRVGIDAIAQAIYTGLTHGVSTDPQPDNYDNDPVIKPVDRSVLVDAAKWYRGLPHQDEAWRWLENHLDPIQIMDFRSGYTPDSIPVKQPIQQASQSPLVLPSKPPDWTRSLTDTMPATPKSVPSIMSVANWIDNGDGSTNGVKGLSDQIIAQMGNAGLVEFTHPRFKPSSTCDPYFHPLLARKLKAILDAILDAPYGLDMHCNSAYRSPVRQFVLRTFYERKMHGITAAARVGTGNHERGLALDLEDWQVWKPILTSAGFSWQGMGDPMHFDLDTYSMVPHEAIKAFQKLANKHASAGLEEDGICGEKTKQAMLAAPASGW